MADLFVEFFVKGKDRMQVGEFDLWGHVSPLMQLKWYAWIGAAFFFWGWIHQRCCHAILVSLICPYDIFHSTGFHYSGCRKFTD